MITVARLARSFLRFALRATLWSVATLFTLWAAAAVVIDGPRHESVRIVLAGAVLLAGPCLVFAARPRRHARWLIALPSLAVLAWWLTLAPRADRDWAPGQERLAEAVMEDGVLTVRNVRSFRYGATEAEVTPTWETHRYRLDEVVGYDLYLSFWGPTLYAHTISSWEFVDGRHLAISIETRREQGEDYSAVGGFFRQFELHYVVADERDVVGVRAAHRGERLFLYRLAVTPETAGRALVDFMQRVNALARQPAWYNALTTNCTTTIWHHARHVVPDAFWDWRMLANGRLDELAYERAMVDRTLPFEAMRERSEITARAAAAIDATDFSARIREGLPPRPPPRGPRP